MGARRHLLGTGSVTEQALAEQLLDVLARTRAARSRSLPAQADSKLARCSGVTFRQLMANMTTATETSVTSSSTASVNAMACPVRLRAAPPPSSVASAATASASGTAQSLERLTRRTRPS